MPVKKKPIKPMKLGTRVKFNLIYIRKRSMLGTEYPHRPKHLRTWESFSWDITEGVVVGVRTIWNGEKYTEEGVALFHAKESRRAYLIAFNLRDKPVLVPFNNPYEI
jgi:hypothetical protein